MLGGLVFCENGVNTFIRVWGTTQAVSGKDNNTSASLTTGFQDGSVRFCRPEISTTLASLARLIHTLRAWECLKWPKWSPLEKMPMSVMLAVAETHKEGLLLPKQHSLGAFLYYSVTVFLIWYRSCQQHILAGFSQFGLFPNLAFSNKAIWAVLTLVRF